MTEKSILVVLAHPDDESFPMGGTLAKYASQGVDITLICATKGEAGIAGLSSEEAGRIRERELQAAASVLGIRELRFLGYEDGKLDQAPRETVVNQLIRIMRWMRPQAVITFGPDGISGHPDHVAIHQFTTEAFDRADLPGALFYLAPSEATFQGCGVVPPNEVMEGSVASIDVNEYLATKVRAMQCHASQTPPFAGRPEDEASRLACHEFFALARPADRDAQLTDLFDALPHLERVDTMLLSIGEGS